MTVLPKCICRFKIYSPSALPLAGKDLPYLKCTLEGCGSSASKKTSAKRCVLVAGSAAIRANLKERRRQEIVIYF